jgi:3-methyl-2-oxobutanoate hydroxymethyltransferase
MVTTETIIAMKKRQEKIVCLTAYDYPTARILDESGIDIILVGDSAANVFAGEKYTLPITMVEMLYHARVVSRAVENGLVIADMPFLSYQTSIRDAIYNAGRFLKVGACGVKLEGGAPIVETIKRLVDLGIPVIHSQSTNLEVINYRVKQKKRGQDLLRMRNCLNLQVAFHWFLKRFHPDSQRRLPRLFQYQRLVLVLVQTVMVKYWFYMIYSDSLRISPPNL